ncbi:asparagine synthase B [Wenzhouxiangella sp. XN79A]|uniref:asparagine synthase B n=1 Tax=Wenzhouxiangella sp. XN79A TaxID=2724193 RepID=UPI00144A8D89|nr:asparagine synthase B [Wenzhouxiangella sp. XN79A]NKI36584.1 asparagine synthase B [Wenzhouxiangella sp. XN79A]
MCSILGFLDRPPNDDGLRGDALARSKRQRHRGPDWSGVHEDDGALICHERLAIVDPSSGAQPLYSQDRQQVLAVNGEIYNHRALEQRHGVGDALQTGSDCEVILPLYRRLDPSELCRSLNGIYAFLLWDRAHDDAGGRYLVARDPIGVMPLYWGHDAEGRRVVASELKAIHDLCDDVEAFPPGHVYDSATDTLTRFFDPPWRHHLPSAASAPPAILDEDEAVAALARALDAAVTRQLMCDVPYGALLSGGLDSSIIAALAARHAARRVESGESEPAWFPRLHTFSVGLAGSPDLAAAQLVADHIGSVHHGFTYTIQEGLDALPDVIAHLETFDVTTIRAATPMFLMARRIKAMGIKMVLSGEGADELFGGYLYFHKAPNAKEFHEETVRKVDALHRFDCLRANKSTAAWGVEARVPFLDNEVIDVAMRIDPALKMTGPERMEKHLLRRAFAHLLPESVAWRQKEQFSDGVGYGWIDALRENAEREVSAAEFAAAGQRFPIHPPQTREAFYYRRLFAELYPSDAAARTVPGGKSIACSSEAALAWDPDFANRADPSGRSVAGVHRGG